MILRVALAFVAVLLAPAPALAQSFGTAAPEHARITSPECIGSTGGPGEVVTTTSEGPQLLHAARTGFTAGALPAFSGTLHDCALAATSGTGAASVVVCCVGEGTLAATFREPGTDWSTPTELTPLEGWAAVDPDPAVSDRGDAVVAFDETRYAPSGRIASRSVAAVLKAPGGGFGTPQVLGGPYRDAPAGIQAKVAATGEAFVLWHAPASLPNTVDVMVAIAPPGGPFGAPVRLAQIPRLSQSSLAVAQDGHALISLSDRRSVLASERSPGAAFSVPVAVAALGDPVGARTSATLGAQGEAAIAWSGTALGGIDVATRGGPGAFSTPVRLAAPDRTMAFDVFVNSQSYASMTQLPGIWRFGGGDVETALAQGRAVVTWSGPFGARRAAHLATVGFDGSAPTVKTAGGQFADPSRAHPFLLADGTPAVMWTDSNQEIQDVRVWFAADGAARVEPDKLPRVTIGPMNRVTGLAFRCSAACEIRAVAVGKAGADVRVQWSEAQTGTVHFDDDAGAVQLGRRVRLRITYGALDGTRTRTVTVTRLVHEFRAPSKVRLIGLRAVRQGDAIRVTWRLSGEQPSNLAFDVTGSATRGRFVEPLVSGGAHNGGGQRSFGVTLRPAAGVRYVTLYSYGLKPLKRVLRVR
jgi:hypothetical protein